MVTETAPGPTGDGGDPERLSQAAQSYFEAAILEFDAACLTGNPVLIKPAREKCADTLEAYLDARHALTKYDWDFDDD